MSHPKYEPLFEPFKLTGDEFLSLQNHPATKKTDYSVCSSAWRFLLTKTNYYSRVDPYYTFIRKHLPGPYLLKNPDFTPDNESPKYLKSERTLDELPEDIISDVSKFVSYPKDLGPNQITTDPTTEEVINSERLAKPNHQKLNTLLFSTVGKKSSVGKTYSDPILLFSAAIPLKSKKGYFLLHLGSSDPQNVQPFLCVNSLPHYLSRAKEFHTFTRDPFPLKTLPQTVSNRIKELTNPDREHLHLLTIKGI